MDKLCQATPSASLEEQIRSSTVPKNEREWWAKRHIDYLYEVIDERNRDIESLRQQLAECENEKHDWYVTAKELERDIAECERDAKRYRWLRGHDSITVERMLDKAETTEELDAAIDEAITKVCAGKTGEK